MSQNSLGRPMPGFDKESCGLWMVDTRMWKWNELGMGKL